MLKLYRVTDSDTEYWEAWYTATEIITHWGVLGEKGQQRALPIQVGTNPSETVDHEAKPLRAAGFKPMKESDLRCVAIQFRVRGHGTAGDFDKRVEVENLMNECLGWTGLGHCDGGDLGSGTMNIFCFVVDSGLAQRIIVEELQSHGLIEGAIIAERHDSNYQVLWPPNFTSEFSID